ncbi:hypothetical protein LF941_02885 [Pectobacterium versatile]|uniref:capsular polysaccharide export protein, LipB/KpsS family n=1 Tax=Pectobacterium versatile TaxID=2488639 RepID=UPI000C7F4A73|nr:hypothetical protein [Pectobacterium versatile]MCA6914334.1 hypothetical protein [Pectobacterium versatile]PLY38643.1 hypothetical protein F164LOC_02150 [Pectobacterium carotovorum]
MKKEIVIMHVISLEEITFLFRFENALMSKKLVPVYTTTSLFCYFYLRLRSKNVFIARYSSGKPMSCEYDNRKFFNVEVGWLTKENAIKCYEGMLSLANKLVKEYKVKACFIPSGRLASHEALKKVCDENNIPTIFSGYGNFPGKTFFDPAGTDKASSIYDMPEKLERYSYNKDDYGKWRKEYISSKLKSHVVTQAQKVTYKSYLSRTMRILFCKIERFFNVATDVDRGLSSLKDLKAISLERFQVSSLPTEFCFFPLQYSLDAQIILNYSGDYVGALEGALAVARERCLPLVIKPHPVENSNEAFNLVDEFVSKNPDVYVSLTNTFQLISAAKFVITVNSTVGLESKILDKDVVFLGDSIYKGMTEESIPKYLFGYLVDVDYFAKSAISDNLINEIFDKCGVLSD